MPRLLAIIMLFSSVALSLVGVLAATALNAQTTETEDERYRLLATTRMSTLEKELNEAAADGFRFVSNGLSLKQTRFSVPEVLTVLEKAVKGDPNVEYLVLSTHRMSTLQKETAEAAAEGYTLVGQIERAGDLVAILERPVRLNQLGSFEPIEERNYEVIKKPSEGEVDIVVNAKEKSQESTGLSGGVSGVSGSFFGINYQSNNFRGHGQRIDIQVLTGTRTSQYRFSFTEPYFRDTPMSLGLSVFRQSFDTLSGFFRLLSTSDTLALFSENNTGFSVSGSYPVWRWTRIGLSYSYQSIGITDSQLLGFTHGGSLDEVRKGLRQSEITPSLVYNTKNQPVGATQGSQLGIQVPISGGLLGGTFNTIRPTVEYQHLMPDRFLSGGRHTLAFQVQMQHIIPFGKLPNGEPMTVPFFERIFSGGELTLRGFDIRSVSPWVITQTPSLDNLGSPLINPATGGVLIFESVIPVGGDTSLILTTEYRMPIFGPLQVTGFFDFGTSTVLRKSNLRIFGPTTNVILQENTNNVWRASTGAEVQFLLPVVNQPFRLFFAYNPLILDTTIVSSGRRFFLRERRKSVGFTVGYSF